MTPLNRRLVASPLDSVIRSSAMVNCTVAAAARMVAGAAGTEAAAAVSAPVQPTALTRAASPSGAINRCRAHLRCGSTVRKLADHRLEQVGKQLGKPRADAPGRYQRTVVPGLLPSRR